MKTPRELLLKHHESAHHDLDALRRKVLARECGRPGRNAGPWSVRLALKLWSELIQPAPRIWTGFAAVWLAIIALHLADRTPPTIAAAIQSPVDSAGTLLPWKEQEKILAEFILPTVPLEAEPPKSPAPKPRSQWRSDWLLG